MSTRWRPGPSDARQRGVEPGDVAGVRRHDEHAAPGRRGGAHEGGDRDGRVLARARGPDRPRSRSPRSEAARRVREAGDERRPSGVRRPSRGTRRGGRRQRELRAPGGVERLLHRRVPRRHRGAQDVDESAGPPVGDRAGQRGDLGGEHRVGAHDLREALHPAGVVRARDALQHPAVDERAREADPHARTGDRRVRERRGDDVVEGAVEVRQGDVDRDPRDRVDLGRARRGRRPGLAHLRGDQRELLVGGRRGHG